MHTVYIYICICHIIIIIISHNHFSLKFKCIQISWQIHPHPPWTAPIPRAHSLGGLAKASANVVAADKQALEIGTGISVMESWIWEIVGRLD